MTLIEIATIGTFLISALALLRTIWDKRFEQINKRFDKIDENFKEVHLEIKEIRHDISDVKERLAFIEASTFFIEISPDPRKRSESAKRMWEKRKERQLEKKND